MCGLAGWLRPNGFAARGDAPALLRRMTDAITHRGPDDAGEWIDPSAGVALGHRRLSIVDLSPAGHQPMVSVCGRFVIAFNGEIYNHRELRQKLEAERGTETPDWRGHSDTETLLAAFSRWGIARTLQVCVGMFAIALWDRQERVLTLARDRMGEKPLYYGTQGDTFFFGSELKALKAHPAFRSNVDRGALALLLRHNYIPAPYSIYQGIRKLPAGSYIQLRSGQFDPQPVVYWSLVDVAAKGQDALIHDDQEAIDQVEAVLSQAIGGQSIADVPLGAFLSGGLDSSLIVALMQAQTSRPVRTFTIGFDEAGFNEAEHAKRVALHLGTEHTELYVTQQQAREVIPRLPSLYSEPFADSSQIPTYLVSQMARQHVTVALSGDAGDELFGGYNRYVWGSRLWNRARRFPAPLRRILGAGIQAVPPNVWDRLGQSLPRQRRIGQLGDKARKLGQGLSAATSLDGLYASLVSEWQGYRLVHEARDLPTLLDDSEVVRGLAEPEHRMMAWDALTYLPDDILCKVDRAAMGVSLETRVPFLDHRVVELAWRLPLHMKIRNAQGKWALRQVLYRHLPRGLMERPKAGFAIPVGLWLRGPLREWAEDLLSESRLRQEGFFDPEPIRLRWAEHVTGRRDWTPALWAVLMFQAWLHEQRQDPAVCSSTAAVGTSDECLPIG